MPFHKYHGTGNDFICLDLRELTYDLSRPEVIAGLCHRRFGIGADGLLALVKAKGYDFGMKYYNADGQKGSMCGNGGRCIAAFARDLGIIDNEATFLASDGVHKASFLADGRISLSMSDVTAVSIAEDGAYHLETGSPHYVLMTHQVDDLDVLALGKAVRQRPEFAPKGINVNYVQILQTAMLKMRTYERGVEDETYSCGTGAVAAAVAYCLRTSDDGMIAIETKGGHLEVSLQREGDTFRHVELIGPAKAVFQGTIASH